MKIPCIFAPEKCSICMLAGEDMRNNAVDLLVDLPDSLWLKHYFFNYANPKAKISLLVRQGLFETSFMYGNTRKEVYYANKCRN